MRRRPRHGPGTLSSAKESKRSLDTRVDLSAVACTLHSRQNFREGQVRPNQVSQGRKYRHVVCAGRIKKSSSG